MFLNPKVIPKSSKYIQKLLGNYGMECLKHAERVFSLTEATTSSNYIWEFHEIMEYNEFPDFPIQKLLKILREKIYEISKNR